MDVPLAIEEEIQHNTSVAAGVRGSAPGGTLVGLDEAGLSDRILRG
jgi:hypothetical protein